jgi:hypothetical protein
MRTSTKRIVLAAGFVGMVATVAPIVFAQASNPQIGTWKMNVAKSKVNAGVMNKSGTTKIESAGAGVKATVDTVTGEGTTQHWQFTSNYDGKDGPITGNSPYGDAIAQTRVDANTIRSVYKKNGKVTVTGTSVVSADGKTRTVTNKGTNVMGQPVDSVTFYDKQ